jgi:hypothetical protein
MTIALFISQNAFAGSGQIQVRTKFIDLASLSEDDKLVRAYIKSHKKTSEKVSQLPYRIQCKRVQKETMETVHCKKVWSR